MPKLTPAAFFEAPTISAAIPNPAGTHAVYQETSYSYTTHSKSVKCKLLNLTTKEQAILLEDDNDNAAPAVWLSDEHVIWLSTRKTGNTQVLLANVNDAKSVHLVGTIVGKAHGLKVKVLDPSSGDAAIAFAAKANSDGTLWNALDEPKKPHSSFKYYTSNYVRHWDSWITPQRNAIFYSYLRRDKHGKYEMQQVYNALRLTDARLESPTPPFAGADDFDIGQPGLLFVAKDPARDHSLSTARDVYLLKTDFRSAAGKAEKVGTPGLEGHAGFPRFSADGRNIAFLKMKHEGYESDKQRPMLIEDASSLSARELLQSSDGEGAWPLTPETLIFLDDNTLILTAYDKARSPVFALNTTQPASQLPIKLAENGSIKHIHRIGQHKLLITGNSLTDSGYIGTLNLSNGFDNVHLDMLVSSADYSEQLSLSADQITDLHWKGDHDREIHGLMMKPPNFNDKDKYPVCIILHGGPQYALQDEYSDGGPRPQIFASQGYLTFCPNFTGSRGYGQPFTDAIRNNWGGSPYIDIVNLFSYIEKEIPYADTSRAIAGGLSFGGYMTNWIQGQPLGRKFRALFTHNGIFSMTSMLASEELFFPHRDLAGFPWDSDQARANWDKYDPSRFTHNWNTPHFIMHTDKDFRLGVDNGLAAFNVLQARGVESGFLYFEGEGHVVEKENNLVVVYGATLNFVNRFVGLEGVGEEVMPIR